MSLGGALICAAMVTSCIRDGGNLPVALPDNDRVAIVPEAGFTSVTPESRGDLPSGPVTGTSFAASTTKLFAVTAYKGTIPSGNYSAAYFDNQPVQSDALSKLSFTTDQYYPADGADLYFYAYSPVAAAGSPGYAEGTTTTPPTVTWTIDGQQDIMAAQVISGYHRVPSGQTHPNFPFTHKLTRVQFKFVRGTGFGGGINVTSISLKNCKPTATLNLMTGDLTFSGTPTSLTLTGAYPIKATADNPPVIDKSLMCEAGASSLLISVTAGGITYLDCTVPLASTQSGKNHLVTLTFEGTKIEPTATITNWEDGGTGGGTIK
jgi:hypothetical protein